MRSRSWAWFVFGDGRGLAVLRRVGDRPFAVCEAAGLSVAHLSTCRPRRRRDGRPPDGPPFVSKDAPASRRVRGLAIPIGVTDLLVLVVGSDDGAPLLTAHGVV